MNLCKNLRNYNLRIIWTSSALLQTNFIISTNLSCTNFNTFTNPSMFLYMLYWCSVTALRWSRQFVTRCSYDKLCKKYHLNICAFVGFIVWIPCKHFNIICATVSVFLLCEYRVNTLILSVQLCQSSYLQHRQAGRKETREAIWRITIPKSK
jgi:hypothetical protein